VYVVELGSEEVNTADGVACPRNQASPQNLLVVFLPEFIKEGAKQLGFVDLVVVGKAQNVDEVNEVLRIAQEPSEVEEAHLDLGLSELTIGDAFIAELLFDDLLAIFLCDYRGILPESHDRGLRIPHCVHDFLGEGCRLETVLNEFEGGRGEVLEEHFEVVLVLAEVRNVALLALVRDREQAILDSLTLQVHTLEENRGEAALDGLIFFFHNGGLLSFDS